MSLGNMTKPYVKTKTISNKQTNKKRNRETGGVLQVVE
jgi:hypothetical protein